MAEELKACPFCSCTDIGEVTINLILEQRHRRFKVYCKACQCRTSEHKTRKEARIYWNTRAQLPSQGGEAIEVVAYRGKDPDGGEGFVGARWPDAFGEDCIVERLMTVAQHQRILAASVGSAEPVAYAAFADNGNIRMWCRSAIGMCELFDAHGNKAVPLYTHPADQVADDLTMVKASRELLEDLRDCANECYNHARMRGTSGLDHYENLTEQADALLANNGGVKP